MTRPLPFALALALALAAAPARAEPKMANRIAAVVGDEPITLRALQIRARRDLAALDRAPDPPQEKAQRRAKVLREALRHMIDERLVERAARAARIEVGEDLIRRAIDRSAAELHISREAFLARSVEVELAAYFRRYLLEWMVLDRAYLEIHDESLTAAGGAARRQAFRAQWLEAQAREVGVEVRLVGEGV